MPVVTRTVRIKRVLIIEVLRIEIDRAEQGVEERLLVKVGEACVVVGHVELVLEEDQAAARTRFAVGVVAQGIVRAESLGRFAAADSARHVVLAVDHVVPEAHHGAVIVDVARLHRHIGHARVGIRCPHGVTDRLVLLDDRDVALVVFRTVLAAVQEELGQLDVSVALALSLGVVDETPEPNQSDLHRLMAVVPFLLRGRPDVGVPAVGELLGRVVETQVLAPGEVVVGHSGFEEVARDVALVIAPVSRGPVFAIAQGEGGLEIAVRLLSGQNLGNPILQRRLQSLLGLDDLPVALWIDHQGHADRFDRVVDPGIGEDVAAMPAVGLAGQLVGRIDEVVDSAFPEVRIGDLRDAVRNPVDDQGLGPVVPQATVDPVRLGIDQMEVLRRRRRHDLDIHGR